MHTHQKVQYDHPICAAVVQVDASELGNVGAQCLTLLEGKVSAIELWCIVVGVNHIHCTGVVVI